MASYPNNNIPASSLHVYLNRQNNAGNTNKIQGSDSYTLTRTTNGTAVNINQQGNASIKYRNVYTASNAYHINDVVYVSSSFDYIDTYGISYSITDGTWICTRDVPPIYDAVTSASIAASPYLTEANKNTIIRQSNVVYYPCDVSGSYWRKMGSSVNSGGSSDFWC